MTVDVSPFFRPIRINELELPNRIVMSPMTRTRSPDGVPTEEVAAYYRRRAEAGVGMLITEGTVIDRPRSRNNPNIPSVYGVGLEGWRSVVDDVHRVGGRIWSQLWHVGALPDPRAPADWAGEFEGPSGLGGPDQDLGHAMTDSDVADTIDAFGRAAADAHRTGFDGIELHAAHGYLIDQFFWASTNRRTDRWGGDSLLERSRFAVEIVRAARAAIPAGMPLGIRISQFKIQDYDARLVSTPAEFAEWIEPLADAGIDVFHCSQREFNEPAFSDSTLNLAGWAKRITGKPSITVGAVGVEPSFYDPATGNDVPNLRDLADRMSRDEFDLVAVGRALLSDPLFVTKLREGRFDEMTPFSRQLISGALI